LKLVPVDDNAQPNPAPRAATQLFVYGTLRHDQPEHGRFCRGVTGWRRARVRGRLWRISSGYLLLVVPPGDVLLGATSNPAADEHNRTRLAEPDEARRRAAGDGEAWVHGEVLSFRDAAEAWPTLDRWEDFSPDLPGAYQRCVVPVRMESRKDGEPEEVTTAWAYVATEPPARAFPLGAIAGA